MTLLDMQRAFSRLLTDKEFRQAIEAGDDAVWAPYELTPVEVDGLRGLRWDRVNLHSELLANGRMELALRVLPLSGTVLHEPLHHLVDRFCAEFPPVPQPDGTLFVEAERLCEFLIRRIDEGTLGQPWVRDVVIYERTLMRLGSRSEAWASATRVAALNAALDPSTVDIDGLVPVIGPHTELLELRYPLPDLVARLEAGEVPGQVEPLDRPMLYVRTLRVNEPTAALVRACDGVRSVAAVLDLLRRKFGADVDQGALAVLDRLRELGVIGLRKGS
jgi:hypothetical protein